MFLSIPKSKGFLIIEIVSNVNSIHIKNCRQLSYCSNDITNL